MFNFTLMYIKNEEHRDLFERFRWSELLGVKITSREPETCVPVFKTLQIPLGRRLLYRAHAKHYTVEEISLSNIDGVGFFDAPRLRCCLQEMINTSKWTDAHVLTGILVEMTRKECQYIHLSHI